MSKDIINRRNFLRRAGVVGASIPMLGLSACNITVNGPESGTSTDTSGGMNDDLFNPSGWADGGTKSLSVGFPSDTIFDRGSRCSLSLTKPVMEGPCYFEVSDRVDISEGQTGLPMQLCLQVVDANCTPMSGLEVEVWHCNVNGLYSGDTTGSEDSERFISDFCTDKGNSEALASKWFRGTLITDSSGRVNFKTCFPGWYAGRVIHVHFRVRNESGDQIISQFCFSDRFADMICTKHVDYLARGTQDTPLDSDRIFNHDYQDLLFNLARNRDGSLLSYKTIMIAG